MAVIEDHLKNIQRIADVIKSDSTVFDNGETPGKFIDVIFGNPPEMVHQDSEMPCVYVTTKESIQRSSYPYGITSGNSIPQVTVEYKISVISESLESQQESEKSLYDLLKNLRTTLTADPLFSDPANPGNDPIFTRSIINSSKWDTKTKGTPIQIVEFTLTATIGAELTITIPGFGDLVILSDTGDDGRNNIEINNDEGDTKRSKGAFVGSRFFEYEYDTTTWESLESIISASNPIDLTLQYPSGNITYPAKLEYQRQSQRFDGIRTVILQVNRETV